MKTVYITVTASYARPIVSHPHLEVRKGDLVDLDDHMASLVCDTYKGGRIATEADVANAEVRDEVDGTKHLKEDDTAGWSGEREDADNAEPEPEPEPEPEQTGKKRSKKGGKR